MGVRALPCGLDYDQFPPRLFCGDGFSDVLTAYGPLVSGSHFSRLVACRVQVCGSFQEIPSGNVSVFIATWFDSGYSFRQFTISVWQQRQVRTVQTVPGFGLCPFTPFPDEEVAAPVVFYCGLAGLPGTMRRCVGISRCILFVCWQAQIFGIVVDVDWEALHQPVEIPQVPFFGMLLTCPSMCMLRSSITPSWRRGRFPWSSEQIMRFPCCSPLTRWSMSWL